MKETNIERRGFLGRERRAKTRLHFAGLRRLGHNAEGAKVWWHAELCAWIEDLMSVHAEGLTRDAHVDLMVSKLRFYAFLNDILYLAH